MLRIVIATCNAQPFIQPGDAVFTAALEARGACVVAAPWNGPQAAFASADAIVIRSTWDYQETPTAFESWFAGLDSHAAVFNAPTLMRWNMSKRYLFSLGERGVPMPLTRLVEPSPEAIVAAMDELELAQAVVKPEYGATGSGLSLVARDDPAGIERAAEKMAMPGVIQAFMTEIASRGETSFVFIDGEFTHAVTKRPRSGEILSQKEYGGSTEPAYPPPWAVQETRAILALAPGKPIYARIDAILLDGRLQLMEVELIEPELFFTYCPEAAVRFASALLKRL